MPSAALFHLVHELLQLPPLQLKLLLLAPLPLLLLAQLVTLAA